MESMSASSRARHFPPRPGRAGWPPPTGRPPETESPRFVNRLLAIGAAKPNQILLPTSDETAWLYAAYAGALKKYFCLYQPPLATIQRILDKQLLTAAASSVGLPVLPSWDPSSIEDLEAQAPSLPYPILIKPRTHVHRLRNDKGTVVHSAGELIPKYSLFVDRELVSSDDEFFIPRARLPMLQQFVRVADEGIVSITGFIDQSGEYFISRRSVKIFQRTQPVGVGVCFESLPAAAGLAELAHRLCRELGYFGIFEIEFIRYNGSWAVIDFNPRLFNQVGLDVRRGMPLPLLSFLDAAGEKDALRTAVANAQREQETTTTVFYDHFTLRAILFTLAATGRLSHQERSRWRCWMTKNAASAIDVAADPADPIPGIVHIMSEIYLGVRAFPRFLRSTSRRSVDPQVRRREEGRAVTGPIAIIGAGPYGLSLAAHLAGRKIEHRIFGRPMQFWSQIAEAGGERYLKSYCFGTNISTPMPGSSFAEYSAPRGLETIEPCSIADFAAYGLWFQQKNVPWIEPLEADRITKAAEGFEVALSDGERFIARRLVLATGLSCFAYVPPVLASLPPALVSHSSTVKSFTPFKGRSVAVIGGGQSALEVAALLREAGGQPELLVRASKILWNRRVSQERSLWQRVRSPISGLGTGPKAWLLS